MSPTYQTSLLLPVPMIAILVGIFWLLLSLAMVRFYVRYLGFSRAQSRLLWLVLLPPGIGAAAYRLHQSRGVPEWLAAGASISAGLAFLFIAPLAIKLYQAWIGEKLTPEERAPGAEGVRAWLRGGNLVCAAAVSVLVAIGFGYSIWGLLALTFGALLAYPAINTLLKSPGPATPAQDLSGERERVLKMVEDGRITAEESAELLNALGQTVQVSGSRPEPVTPARRLVLVGALLLLVGFFLPWFSINPGRELDRFGGQMIGNLGTIAPEVRQMPFPRSGHVTTWTVRIAGGDIQGGLGWLVLVLGMGAAMLPLIIRDLDSQTRWTISLVALSVGAVALLYLATQNFRYASIGLVLCLGGYALEFMGTLKERRI